MLGLGLGITFVQRTGSPMWTPLDSGDVVAWYRMDLGATVGSGSSLTALADQSGTGDANKNLTAVNGSVTVASDAAYGNHQVASFSVAPRMEAAGAWSSTLSPPFTIYAVGESSDSGITTLVDGEAGHRAILFGWGTWQMYGGSAYLNSGINPSTPAALCGVFNGASSAFFVDDFGTAAASGNPGSDSITKLTLGDVSGGGAPLAGKIAEVIVCSGAHDGTKRAAFRSYLARYGL